MAIYNREENRVGEYAYDAWGNCTVTYSGDYNIAYSNPILYRGYYYDRSTGLYYLNARYYNPQWRRFISPDSTDYLDHESVNGLNLYAYCNNDPVNYADPSGHAASLLFPLLILVGASIVGGISGGLISVHIQNSNEENGVEELSASHIILSSVVGASIGLMVGGIILFGFGVAGGTAAIIAGKSITKATALGMGIKELLALSITSYNLGGIIASTITGISFELIEWISKYNTRQPNIGP